MALIAAVALVTLTACSYQPDAAVPTEAQPQTELVYSARTTANGSTAEVRGFLDTDTYELPDNSGVEDDPELIAEVEEGEVVEEPRWSEEELYAMAKTLAGECWDDKEHDKRLVCEVIVNRVGDPEFGMTILEVLTKPSAFCGYWRQARPISENDYAVAEQALRDWYDNGCKPLSEWLFFSSGPNRENVFRTKF